MARRKESGLDVVAGMPWQAGVVLGIVAYFAIRYGIGWFFGTTGGPIGQEMARQLSPGLFGPLAWLALVACWIAALVSFLRQKERQELLDAQTGLDSFAAMGWQQFEMLVGEAYRRQGYAVEETGLGGKDGGIDLILRKSGRTTLVQVKQWRRQRVDVRVVREMYGLMAHHGADAVRIAALGGFTNDAQRFAEDKDIELIDAPALLALVSSVQPAGVQRVEPTWTGAGTFPLAADTAPACSRCGSPMVNRTNRTTGDTFWGCTNYPRCKGTRHA